MRNVFVLALLAGCTKPVPRPTMADATRASISLDALERGRERYVQRCGTCHVPYQPSAYKPADWPRHVDQMAERAKLGTDDRASILQFLVTLAGR